MGLTVQDYTNRDGQIMDTDLFTGHSWIVMRVEEREELPRRYHILGVFDEEADAVKAIEIRGNPTYFLGPLPRNILLSEDTIEWIGLYYPLPEKALDSPS
jgi:hypothetical protein